MSNQVYANQNTRYIDRDINELDSKITDNSNDIDTLQLDVGILKTDVLTNTIRISIIESKFTSAIFVSTFKCGPLFNTIGPIDLNFRKIDKTITMTIETGKTVLVPPTDVSFIIFQIIPEQFRPLVTISGFCRVTNNFIGKTGLFEISSTGLFEIFEGTSKIIPFVVGVDEGWDGFSITYAGV